MMTWKMRHWYLQHLAVTAALCVCFVLDTPVHPSCLWTSLATSSRCTTDTLAQLSAILSRLACQLLRPGVSQTSLLSLPAQRASQGLFPAFCCGATVDFCSDVRVTGHVSWVQRGRTPAEEGMWSMSGQCTTMPSSGTCACVAEQTADGYTRAHQQMPV